MSEFNIVTTKGDTWQGYQATILIEDVPLDLTNALIKMQLKKNASDCHYALEFSTLSTESNVITITDALNGQFTVEPEIVDIVARTYVYDTEITTLSGRVLTVLKGTFTVEQDVTQ